MDKEPEPACPNEDNSPEVVYMFRLFLNYFFITLVALSVVFFIGVVALVSEWISVGLERLGNISIIGSMAVAVLDAVNGKPYQNPGSQSGSQSITNFGDCAGTQNCPQPQYS